MHRVLNPPLGSRGCPRRRRSARGCTKTVLVVDDNPDDAFFLRHALLPVIGGCQLLVVTDGIEAEELLGALEVQEQSALPSVIFTDLHMPRRNGFQLLRWIKQRPRCAGIPVVMVSSFDDPADVEKASALGAVACLRKPPEPEEVQRLTAFLIDRFRAHSHRRDAKRMDVCRTLVKPKTVAKTDEPGVSTSYLDTRPFLNQ
jgi:CheY-like chemotaxis protein